MKVYLAYIDEETNEENCYAERVLGVFDAEEKAQKELDEWMKKLKEHYIEMFGEERYEEFYLRDKPRIVTFELNKSIKYGHIL